MQRWNIKLDKKANASVTWRCTPAWDIDAKCCSSPTSVAIVNINQIGFCPRCKVFSGVPNGTYNRSIRTLNGVIATIVNRIRCEFCNKNIPVEIPYVSKYKRYGKDVQRKALEDYFGGRRSYRECISDLERDFRLHCSYVTVFYWSMELGERAADVIRSEVMPRCTKSIGKTIEADEVYFKGMGRKISNQNIIDSPTWLILHSHMVYGDATKDDTRGSMSDIYFNGIYPERIITDGNDIYPEPIRENFERCTHTVCEFHLEMNYAKWVNKLIDAETNSEAKDALVNIRKNAWLLAMQHEKDRHKGYTTINNLEGLHRFQKRRHRLRVSTKDIECGNKYQAGWNFYWNFRRFMTGKRKGFSPLMLAGYDHAERDWLEHLGYPRLKYHTEMISPFRDEQTQRI
jgi:hypothetical protein